MSSDLPRYQIGNVGPGAIVLQGKDIHNISGFTAEQVQQLVKVTVAGAIQQHAAQIARLAGQLGATQEQVLGFFRIIGEAGIAVEAIPGKLIEIAERYKTLLAQASAAPNDDPETTKLKVALRAALGEPDLERADALLAEILEAQDQDIERRTLQAAATCAQRGEVAMTRLRYHEAATHFAAAVGRLQVAHEVERIDYLNRQARALYFQGDEFGDNPAFRARAARLGRDPAQSRQHAPGTRDAGERDGAA
jgi:hypothetical protein